MSIDVTFFETTPFSLSSPVTSQGEDDDLLVFTIASSTPSASTLAPVLVKLAIRPIAHVYSRRQNPLISSPTLTALSLDPVQNDDLLIDLRKGKR